MQIDVKQFEKGKTYRPFTHVVFEDGVYISMKESSRTPGEDIISVGDTKLTTDWLPIGSAVS